MEHPHPDKLHVVRCYREFIIGFKRKHGYARGLVHYVDFIQTYLTAKRQHFEARTLNLERRLTMKTLLLILTLMLVVPVTARADSFALAEATIEWDQIGMIAYGGLTITHITYAHMQAPPADGLLLAIADAHSVNETVWQTDGASMLETFWLYGNGTGRLIVSVPYSLRASCTDGTAVAAASLSMWNGSSMTQSDSLECGRARSGMFTVSLEFNEPTWGPLVSIQARSTATAMASVSEPSTLLLFPFGLAGLMIVGKKYVG